MWNKIQYYTEGKGIKIQDKPNIFIVYDCKYKFMLTVKCRHFIACAANLFSVHIYIEIQALS